MRYAHYCMSDDVPIIKPSMTGAAEQRGVRQSSWRDERGFWNRVAWNIHTHRVIEWHSGNTYNLDLIMLSDWNLDSPVTIEEVVMFYYLTYFSQERRISLTVGELAYILSVDRQNYLASLRESAQTSQRIRSIDDDTKFGRTELHWFGSPDLFPVMHAHISAMSNAPPKRKKVITRKSYAPDERYSTMFWSWAAMYPSYDMFRHLTETEGIIRMDDVTRMYRECVVPSQQIPYDTLLRYWSRGCYNPAMIAAADKTGIEPDLALSMLA